MKNLDERLASAVQHFWTTRARQGQRQGRTTGQRDYGNRTVATGGRQLDGFSALVRELLVESGIPGEIIFDTGRDNVTLPGFFRPTKQWDVVVVVEGQLLAAIEFKALCGPSFGNNYNNRVEEALGSATDIWTAYRDGAFGQSPQPFLGYLLLLEEHEKSMREVSVLEKHFSVFDDFRGASYALRCEHSLRRLVRERSYNAASFILSSREGGLEGCCSQPADDLAFELFATALCGHVKANYDVVRGDTSS